MLPLALGSQTGGSIIRPAAYCGVAGFKPSYRLLPTVGMKCFSWSLDTVGLFAAGVADVAFAAAAISGRDLRVDGRPPAAPAIAIVRTGHWDDAERADAATRSSARRAPPNKSARASGISICRRSSRRRTRAFGIIQDYEAFRALGFEYDRHRDRLGPILRRQLDDAAAIDADAYDDARRTTRRARRALLDLLADGEVMLTPSAPGAAPLIASHRRADLQPAVDAAGHALRQRPGACRTRRACRSACRSSRASGATGSPSPPRHSSSRRSELRSENRAEREPAA